MKDPIKHFGFNPQNYIWLFIGIIINVLGFILMIGGGAEDLNEFNSEELFSTTRITIAPMLIIAGYVVILFSIMKKTKIKETTEPGVGWQLLAFLVPIAGIIMFINNRKEFPQRAQRYALLVSLAFSIGILIRLLKLLLKLILVNNQ
jgi:hypothetical protein